jgi:6-pyruvoyltetrahydropterin/6-carboxytetrahydropterin synthase
MKKDCPCAVLFFCRIFPADVRKLLCWPVHRAVFPLLPIFTPMIYVSRKEHFNAAHKLYNPAWTKEKNISVFGPCANENWHGHNFDLIVTVKGKPDPETGFVVDLKRLSTMIRKEVIDQLDHKNLNVDVPFMAGKLASCETLIVEIWKIIERHLPTVTSTGKLHCIRLYETPRNYVEYFGE